MRGIKTVERKEKGRGSGKGEMGQGELGKMEHRMERKKGGGTERLR